MMLPSHSQKEFDIGICDNLQLDDTGAERNRHGMCAIKGA